MCPMTSIFSFFKQKRAYEVRISDWSSDVCSSDLFFNASGMATPDDLEEFRSCQLTFQATKAPWNDMSRGAAHWLSGPDEVALALDMPGLISAGLNNEDEGLYHAQHGIWLHTTRAAGEREEAGKSREPPSTSR